MKPVYSCRAIFLIKGTNYSRWVLACVASFFCFLLFSQNISPESHRQGALPLFHFSRKHLLTCPQLSFPPSVSLIPRRFAATLDAERISFDNCIVLQLQGFKRHVGRRCCSSRCKTGDGAETHPYYCDGHHVSACSSHCCLGVTLLVRSQRYVSAIRLGERKTFLTVKPTQKRAIV